MLTIAIPTYNRAQHLARQLTWLADAVVGYESSVEILVSDNASTDNTATVVESWQRAFDKTAFTYQRNPTNLGALRNMAACVRFSSRRYVWVVSDDDTMHESAVAGVLDRLQRYPDVGLLALNHFSRYVGEGPYRFFQCYPLEQELHDEDGMRLMSACLEYDHDGIGLITANVFRTDLAQQALAEWSAEENLVSVTFWAGYCAREGGMVLTADTLLECTAGRHFWTGDEVMTARMRCIDTPDVADGLIGLGYPSGVGRKLVVKQAKPKVLRTLGKAFLVDPQTSSRALARFTLAMWKTGPFFAIGFLGGKLVAKIAKRSRSGGGEGGWVHRGDPFRPEAFLQARPGVNPHTEAEALAEASSGARGTG